MRIQIECSEQTYEMDVDCNETVQTVINMFSKMIGKNNENMALKYEGESLPRDKSLKQSGICDNSILNVHWKIKGGLKYATSMLDFSLGLTKSIDVVKGPKGRLTIGRGLNLHGVCINKSCDAFNKRVICHIKDQNFDLVDRNKNIQCPICFSFFHPINCGFFKCKYMFKGKKYNEKNDTIKEIQEKFKYTHNGKYETFEEMESEKCTWITLKIFVDTSIDTDEGDGRKKRKEKDRKKTNYFLVQKFNSLGGLP